jgi:hypothetical protein
MRSKCHKSSSLDAKNVESSDTPQWIAVPRNADPPVFNELPYWWVARSLAGAMHSHACAGRGNMPEKCAKVSATCRTKKLLVPTRSDLFAKAARSFPPLVRVEHEFGTRLALPSPVFPHHPFLIHELDATDIAEHVYRPQTASGTGLSPR